MTLLAFAVLALLLVVAVCALVFTTPAVDDLLGERVRRRVLVTLKTGEAFSGVLYAADADVLVLREAVAEQFGPRAQSIPVGGEALIQRADVAYMQIP